MDQLSCISKQLVIFKVEQGPNYVILDDLISEYYYVTTRGSRSMIPILRWSFWLSQRYVVPNMYSVSARAV